jgi:hypothetical protein
MSHVEPAESVFLKKTGLFLFFPSISLDFTHNPG